MYSNTGVMRIMQDDYLKRLVMDFFRSDRFQSFIEQDKTLNRKTAQYLEFRSDFLREFE
jgi:hypothetical protein